MASTNPSTASTTEFEPSITVAAPADSIFDFVSDVSNVPQYLPTVKNAQPQQGERIRTQGQVGEHSYDSDGHFRVDRQARRIEWGSDGENDYGGCFKFRRMGTHNLKSKCIFTSHLSLRLYSVWQSNPLATASSQQ